MPTRITVSRAGSCYLLKVRVSICYPLPASSWSPVHQRVVSLSCEFSSVRSVIFLVFEVAWKPGWSFILDLISWASFDLEHHLHPWSPWPIFYAKPGLQHHQPFPAPSFVFCYCLLSETFCKLLPKHQWPVWIGASAVLPNWISFLNLSAQIMPMKAFEQGKMTWRCWKSISGSRQTKTLVYAFILISNSIVVFLLTVAYVAMMKLCEILK